MVVIFQVADTTKAFKIQVWRESEKQSEASKVGSGRKSDGGGERGYTPVLW